MNYYEMSHNMFWHICKYVVIATVFKENLISFSADFYEDASRD